MSRPINGDKAKVWVSSSACSTSSSNGFGVRANYTYTDTKAYVGGVNVGDLEGVSGSAYSVALMFENDRWDAQVAADYSGEYTEVIDASAGCRKAEPITWVTASVRTRSPKRSGLARRSQPPGLSTTSHLGRADILAGFETWGRSYLLGATAKLSDSAAQDYATASRPRTKGIRCRSERYRPVADVDDRLPRTRRAPRLPRYVRSPPG